jgi:uncharacterized membrane protein
LFPIGTCSLVSKEFAPEDIVVLNDSFFTWFLYFSATAFLGWMLESTIKSFSEHRLVNSGFLSGPFIPIYGFGALALAFLSSLLSQAPSMLFWGILTLVPTIVEYLVSWLMEKLFDIRLWDYDRKPFNLHGRICLLYSFFWAILAIVTINFIQPFLLMKIRLIDGVAAHYVAGALSMYYIHDTMDSVRALVFYRTFVLNLRRLVEKGRMFVPSIDLGTKKLPPEIKRILKPLKAFPRIAGEMKSSLSAIPKSIRTRLESIIGGKYFR